MSLVKWLFIGVIVLPAAEVVAFLVVAAVLGWWWASCLLIATSLLGTWLLRRTGRANLARFAGALQREGLRALHLESPGVAAVAGGILLALPGFITDIIGLLLLIAPVRRFAGTRIILALRRGRSRRADPSVVELAPKEWHQVSERALDAAARPTRRRRLHDQNTRSDPS